MLIAFVGALLVTALITAATWPLLNPFAPRSRITDVQLVVSTGKESYARDEPVDISIALYNRGPTSLALHTNTSCPGHFRLESEIVEGVFYDSRADMLCLPGKSEVVIPPGAALRSNATWFQKDQMGGPVPVPSIYSLFVWFRFAEGTLLNATGPVVVGSEISLGEHLQAAVETDKTTYGEGEVVHIAASLTNTADWPLMLALFPSCVWFFQVEDEGGDVVYDVSGHDPFCGLTPTAIRLDPGERYQGVLDWGLVDDDGAPVLSPATYVIRAVFVSTNQATATIDVG